MGGQDIQWRRRFALALLAGFILALPAHGLAADQATTQPGGDVTQMTLEDLMSVEVTSVSKTKERIGDAPAAITVITQDDIQRSGLHEIPEILRLSPGLFVQRGNQFTGWSISSRGFGELLSNKLLVLQDGRTVYTPLFSGVYWNTVDYPTADLDRIEVIRGPGATLWGANAVNGVINITTKSARDTQGALVDSRVGTDSSDLAVRYGGRIDADTYYRIYAKGRAYDDMQIAPDPLGQENQWQDTRSGFRIDRYLSNRDTFTLQGDVFDQNASDETASGQPVTGYNHDYRSGENVLARWTHVVSEQSDFSLQAYYDRINFRDPISDFKGNTFDVDFQHRFELAPNHEIIYGVGARILTDDVGSNTLAQPPVDPASRNTYLLSAFIQDTIAVVPDRLHLIVGSKFEHNSYTGFEVQPSARLMWTPDEKTSLWGAVSRAVRTPSRSNEDQDVTIVTQPPIGLPTDFHVGSAHPDSEELLSYEVGVRRQIDKNLSVDVTGFANIYSNLIGTQLQSTTFVPTPTPHILVDRAATNGMSAETYGVEMAAKWQVAPTWRLAGSYSLLTAFVHEYKTDLNPSDSAIEGSYPRNQFQIHSYWDITRKLTLNSSLYYVEGIGGGNTLGTPGPPSGSYFRMDVGVTWTPRPGLELSMGIQNAFDPHHREAPFSGNASSEVDRAVYGQLTWRY